MVKHGILFHKLLKTTLLLISVQQLANCQLVDFFPLKDSGVVSYSYSYNSGQRYSSEQTRQGIITYQIVTKSNYTDYIEWTFTEKESSFVHFKLYYAGNIDTTYTLEEEKIISLTEDINSQNHLLKGTSKIWNFNSPFLINRYDNPQSDTGNVFEYSGGGGPNSVFDKYYFKSKMGLFSRHYSYYVAGTSASWTYIDVSLIYSDILSTKAQSTLPNTDYQLMQNFPNPFNPTTKISFRMPTQTFVTLQVYDIMGREVATVISQYMPAGTHTLSWNSGNLPSGIYFYRLIAGSYTNVKRMIMLK